MFASLWSAYRESWNMLAGKRRTFIFLLLPISLLKIMAPLIIPFMLRMIFDAMESGHGARVLVSVAQSSFAFLLLLMIVYFVNIYGDAWATRLSFYGIRSSYATLYQRPVAQLTASYSKGEIFNRIQAGCSSSLKLWFQSIDLISNFAAMLGLFLMASFISPFILGIIILSAISDFLVSLYLAKRNRQFTKKIQQHEECRLDILHTIVHNSQFLIMHNAQPLVRELYDQARENRFEEEYEQINTNAWLTAGIDVVAAIYHSLLALVLLGHKKEQSVSLGGISSASSIYTNLRGKSTELANAISNLPNSVVPVQRREDLLKLTEKLADQYTQEARHAHIITMENVQLEINGKNVLKNITIKVEPGEKVAIIGRNGCGKSSLLKLMAGLYRQYYGKIQFFGRDVSYVDYYSERGNWISYIPAEPQLYPKQTVYDNVRMGAIDSYDDNINPTLFAMRLNDGSLSSSLSSAISGGEAQRVNISRAMVYRKSLILADEPTSALDLELGERVMDYLLTISETLIFITHNPEHALKAARILVMEDGCIVADLPSASAKYDGAFLNWAGYHSNCNL